MSFQNKMIDLHFKETSTKSELLPHRTRLRNALVHRNVSPLLT